MLGLIGIVSAAWLGGMLWLARSPPTEKPVDALPTEPENDMRAASQKLAYRDTSSHRVGPSASVARSRMMTVRRETPGGPETTTERLARRAEEDRQEMRAGFAAIIETIEGIRMEIRRGNQNDGLMEQRFRDLEWQVNLTRDEVQRRSVNPAPSQIASARLAIKESAKSWPAKVLAVAVGFTAFCVGVGNIPDAARAWDRIWVVIGRMDQPVAKMDDKASR